jgi:biopolymer transport protein ExbD/biopolymer transport protein TolR
MPKVHHAGESSSLRGRGRRVTTSLAEINVVPLVDVMLVLLIIFMVTAPMIQRGIDVNLPVSTRASRIEGERVFVTVPVTYRETRVVFLGDEAMKPEVLQERIRQKMEVATDKSVYLRGDGGVSLREFTEIIDRLKAAGVQNVAFVTKGPGEI